MKQYQTPEMDMIVLSASDVITLSAQEKGGDKGLEFDFGDFEG